MEEKLHRIERELQLMSSDKEMLQSVLKHFFTTKDKRQAVNFFTKYLSSWHTPQLPSAGHQPQCLPLSQQW